MRERVIGCAVVLYLGFGLCEGLLLKTAIPAVNGLGVAYMAVAWPGFIKGSPLEAPIPRWAFTFKTAG